MDYPYSPTIALKLWEADLYLSVFTGYLSDTSHMPVLTQEDTTETDGSHTQLSPPSNCLLLPQACFRIGAHTARQAD